MEPEEIQAINVEASALMKQGIALLNDATPAAAAEALTFFDRALEMRRRLPFDAVPLLRYGLAACLLNRADALMRLEGSTWISDAIDAYDEAIALCRELPMREDPRYPRRLAIAHQNRGLALHAQGRWAAPAAVAAFTEAIAVLDAEDAAAIPDRRFLLAAVWMNLANVYASENAPDVESLGRAAALRAMALVADAEDDDVGAAEVGLKARHVLCQTIARRLLSETEDEPLPEYVHDATDAVDDGLGLARLWERRGVTRFRGVAYDLFRFGARLYDRYQPHFLDEFIRDNVDPEKSSADYVNSAEMRAATQEALRLAHR